MGFTSFPTTGTPSVTGPGPQGPTGPGTPPPKTKNTVPDALLTFSDGSDAASNGIASLFVDLHLVATNMDVSALLMQVLMLALEEDQSKKHMDNQMANANYKFSNENAWHEKEVSDAAAWTKAASAWVSGFVEMAGGVMTLAGALKAGAKVHKSGKLSKKAEPFEADAKMKKTRITQLSKELDDVKAKLQARPNDASLLKQKADLQRRIQVKKDLMHADNAVAKDFQRQSSVQLELSKVVNQLFQAGASFINGMGKGAAAGADLKAGLLNAEGQLIHSRGEMLQLQMNQAYEAGRQAGEAFASVLSTMKDVLSNTQQTTNSIVHAVG
jgi:hypothetical protein